MGPRPGRAAAAIWRRRVVAVMAGAGAWALLLGLSACSPTLDWRQVRPEGWGLVLALPCRPAAQTRQVALAGPAVDVHLLACAADGHTFAVVSADVADPARVGPALLALADAARANVQGTASLGSPAVVAGMTPHPAARRWQLRGQLPDGQPVQEQVLVFSHGTRVFQATLAGPVAGDALAAAFFDAIEVPQ